MKEITKKLIRDRIPEIAKNKLKTFQCKDEEFVPYLQVKLVEEAIELSQAKSEAEFKEEMADVLEVITSLLGILKIDPQEIDIIKTRKYDEHGGFTKGIILETEIEIDDKTTNE